MAFSKVEHLVKIANDFESNTTWSTSLYICFLFTHPLIYLASYLPTYLSTYTFSLAYLHIYLHTYPPTYILFTYLSNH
jgi:hypothetical protein